MKTKKNIWLIGALLLCILVVGCGSNEESGSQELSDKERLAASDSISIHTEYGDLFYPEQWHEFINTEQKNESGIITVNFIAEIDKKTYPLFEVVIGGETGEAVGQIADESGEKRNVYISVWEIEEDPDLSEGEQNRLYAMQEDLNYLIDSLK